MELDMMLLVLKGASFFAALYLTLVWVNRITSLLSTNTVPRPISQMHTLFMAICWTAFFILCSVPRYS